MIIKYFLIIFTIVFLTACGGPSTPSFKKLVLTKSTEFRYKNDFNKSIYLSKNKKVCVLNVKRDLLKVKQFLENYITEEWKKNTTVLKSCVKADFYLKIYTNNDFYGSEFNALKLTIIQRKGKKVVADYTIGTTTSKKVSFDNPTVVNSFSKLFLNSKRIFGN